MGYQSAALAYNFGLNYEFGKRVIKSMSNEKFNKIAEDPILLNELTSRHHDVLLQAFINEVPKVDKIQDLIIKKMVELEFAKIKVMPELIAQIPKGFIEGLFQLGATGETGPNIPQPNPPPPGKGKKPPSGVAPPPTIPKTPTTGNPPRHKGPLAPSGSTTVIDDSKRDVINNVNEFKRWDAKNKPLATQAIKTFLDKMISDLMQVYIAYRIIVSRKQQGWQQNEIAHLNSINQRQVAINSTLNNWNWKNF